MAVSLKILVVDPHRDSADSLAELFRMEGHNADVRYTSEDGAAAFAEFAYDIALADTDSFRIMRPMKPTAKLYMMTGHSLEQLLQHASDDGALGVVQNPSNPGVVVAALAGLDTHGVVLVAEDDPDLGPQLQQLIASTGQKCELVTNGEEALRRMEQGGVDVLILDLNMPLVNGIEVYTTLRDRSMAVPTVMITACSDHYKDALDALHDIELTGILHKPFDPSALLEKLERLAQ